MSLINEHKDELPGKVYKRCTYIVEENLRLQNACEFLEKGDLKGFGLKMYGSHEGLRDKFEVSCPELDQLVEIAKGVDGVLGARMMGGGFGGCTINLVEQDKVEIFETTINNKYKTPGGDAPQIIEVQIEDGTKLVREF